MISGGGVRTSLESTNQGEIYTKGESLWTWHEQEQLSDLYGSICEGSTESDDDYTGNEDENTGNEDEGTGNEDETIRIKQRDA